MFKIEGYIVFILSTVFYIGCLITHISATERKNEEFNLYSYNSYDTIVLYLKNIYEKNQNVVTMSKVGTTSEGRNLYLMKISTNKDQNKPVIFIDANMHAREWATHAIALNLITELVHSPDMLTDVDWYILPMANPDGYEFSRTPGNRMWRKNRVKNKGSKCFGVDLNRNFEPYFGKIGGEFDSCDYQTYVGPNAFSEAESSTIRDVLLRWKSTIKLYISLHAYGNYILHPFGYSNRKVPKNIGQLKRLGRMMANAFRKTSGNVYKVMSASEMYESSGGSDDFAYDVVKIPFVYTLEMTNGYDFEYPENKLSQLYNETLAGFLVAGNEIGKIYKKTLLNRILETFSLLF